VRRPRSCRVSACPRSIVVRISSIHAAEPGPSAGSPRSSSQYPARTRRLLKSWATPPASCPKASIFGPWVRGGVTGGSGDPAATTCGRLGTVLDPREEPSAVASDEGHARARSRVLSHPLSHPLPPTPVTDSPPRTPPAPTAWTPPDSRRRRERPVPRGVACPGRNGGAPCHRRRPLLRARWRSPPPARSRCR
jgi:hypothetical protein